MRASYFLHEYALNKQTIRTQVLISCTWISWFVCFLLIVLIHMFCKGALFFIWHRAYIKLSTIEAFPLSEIKILLLYSFSIVLYWTVAALLFTSSNYFINIEELIVVWVSGKWQAIISSTFSEPMHDSGLECTAAALLACPVPRQLAEGYFGISVLVRVVHFASKSRLQKQSQAIEISIKVSVSIRRKVFIYPNSSQYVGLLRHHDLGALFQKQACFFRRRTSTQLVLFPTIYFRLKN